MEDDDESNDAALTRAWTLTGERIRALRDLAGGADNGYSQKELSELIGISQSHISKIESGKKDLQIESARSVRALFKVTLGFLYEGTPVKIQPKILILLRQRYPHLIDDSTSSSGLDTDSALAWYRQSMAREIPRPPAAEGRRRKKT
jgi:transcriptional regulator with XRE-family HTH domain